MAFDLIVVYDRTETRAPRAGARIFYHALALYDLTATPIRTLLGAQLAPTPSAELPPQVSGLLTVEERAALDAGTAGFELHQRELLPAEFPEVLIQKSIADHPRAKAEFVQFWQSRLVGFGMRIEIPATVSGEVR